MSKRQGWVVLAHREKGSTLAGQPTVFIPAFTSLYRSRSAAERAAQEYQGVAPVDIESVAVAEVRE